MRDVSALLDLPPFSLSRADKEPRLAAGLNALTRHHRDRCPSYAAMLTALGFDAGPEHATADLPFLPARLFKHLDLRSIGESQVRKVLTSSGTSGQAASRIALDAEAAAEQVRVLARIVGDFIGRTRLPMLVIDAPSTVKDRSQFSARAAGILGFSTFGRDVTYALDDALTPDVDVIGRFLAKHGDGPVLMFGFTFVVYQHFLLPLREAGRRLAVDQGVLIHGGGWKKMAARSVDNPTFKALLADITGARRVHNYYGLVEQTGSIFMECETGHLHCSNFSDILVRDADFRPLGVGERGLAQLVSLLPRSYPGHLLLTEDEGVLLGEDDCPCGRKGRYFRIDGRAAQAETRGCSDTFGAL